MQIYCLFNLEGFFVHRNVIKQKAQLAVTVEGNNFNLDIFCNGKSVEELSLSQLTSYLLEDDVTISFVLNDGRQEKDYWIELVFDKNLNFTTKQRILIAEIMYPNQDMNYIDNNIINIKILKEILRALSPRIVFQSDFGQISRMLSEDAATYEYDEIKTSLLIINTEFVSNLNHFASENLHHLEYLDKDVVWINGPTGFGKETPFISRVLIGSSGKFSYLLNNDVMKAISVASDKHASGMSEVLKKIDFNKVFNHVG